MNKNRKICCSSVCGGISLAIGILLLPMTIILVDVIVENVSIPNLFYHWKGMSDSRAKKFLKDFNH